MIKVLAGKIGEYKKETLLTPLFMTLEVALELFIPTVMAALIDNMTGESLEPVVRYGILLFVLAVFSLVCGRASARYGARASTGFLLFLFPGDKTYQRCLPDPDGLSDDDQDGCTDAVDAGVLHHHGLPYQPFHVHGLPGHRTGTGHRLIHGLQFRPSDLPAHLQALRCPEQLRPGKRRRYPCREVLRKGRL